MVNICEHSIENDSQLQQEMKNNSKKNRNNLHKRLQHCCEALISHYGPQQWWPADTTFEVMVGAILTQNTNWLNVERALAQLSAVIPIEAETIAELPTSELAELIRPSGYFNIKARRLQNYCHWFLQQGGEDQLKQLDTAELRRRLLSVNGVGPETADDILLYAFERPVFVVDSYTTRLFERLGLIETGMRYEPLRSWVEEGLVEKGDLVTVFNELHATIVVHAKEYCRKNPVCNGCPLVRMCSYEQ